MSLLWSDKSEYRFPKPAKQEKRKKLSPLKIQKQREQIFEEQDGKCLDCGKPFQTLPEMQRHHLKHSKMGGGSKDDSRSNVVGLCKPCHELRHPGGQWGICKP